MIFTCFKCEVSLTNSEFSEVEGNKLCPKCMGEHESLEMTQTGKAILFVVKNDGEAQIQNWFGTLRFKIESQVRHPHNIAKTQIYSYFTGPDGKRWVAKQFGYTGNYARCKRLKHQPSQRSQRKPNMQNIVITCDGRELPLPPPKKKSGYSLKEVYSFINGSLSGKYANRRPMAEVVNLLDDTILIIDEEGEFLKLPPNEVATMKFALKVNNTGPKGLRGDVLHIESKYFN